MTWPPRVLERSEVAEEDLEYYDGVYARLDGPKHVAGPGASHYAHMMSAPGMAFHLRSIGKLARLAGERGDSFTHSDREWVDQVLAVDLHANLLQPVHLPDAIATGVRLEAVEALRQGREEELTDHERTLADYVRRVVSGRVTEDAWNQMENLLGSRGVVEYTVFILYNLIGFRLKQALGFPDVADADVDALIDELKSEARSDAGDDTVGT